MIYSQEQYDALLSVCRSYKNDYERVLKEINTLKRNEKLKAESVKEQEIKGGIMTEQEQIEEMISTLAASNNPFVDVHVEIMPQVAKALYNAGYRKIPEDSVVLSREEWKQIKNSLYYSKEELEKKLQRERKETAKEIAEKLKQKARGLSLGGDKGPEFYFGNVLLTNDIDELLKEYEK